MKMEKCAHNTEVAEGFLEDDFFWRAIDCAQNINFESVSNVQNAHLIYILSLYFVLF